MDEVELIKNAYADLVEIADRKHLEYLTNPCADTFDVFTMAELEAADFSLENELVIWGNIEPIEIDVS